eukprot:scaffold19985_cov115-Isochrysis_galbana.AAC.6
MPVPIPPPQMQRRCAAPPPSAHPRAHASEGPSLRRLPLRSPPDILMLPPRLVAAPPSTPQPVRIAARLAPRTRPATLQPPAPQIPGCATPRPPPVWMRR